MKKFLIVLGIFSFLINSWLYLQANTIFNSPDEQAVFVFAQNFKNTGSLQILREDIDHIVRPRSVNIYQDYYVPGSFIGLPVIIGSVWSLFGKYSALAFPSIIAVLGLFSFIYIIKNTFDKNTALVSGIILAIMPQWVYYAARGFLPNSIFVSFILISAALIISFYNNPLWYKSLLAGLAISLALFIRPSEIWWLLIPVIVALIIYKKSLINSKLLYALIPVVIIACLQAYFNSSTYGSWLSFGYNQLAESSNQSPSFLSQIILSVFPFGLNIIGSLFRFWQYIIFYWWQFIFIVSGFTLFIKSRVMSNDQKMYTISYLLISLYLIIYYGSLEVFDHPDLTRVSTGIAYVRYWLPIFVMSIPFIVFAINKIKPNLRIILYSFVVLFSFYNIYYISDDNLLAISSNIVQYEEWKSEKLSLIDESGIVISARHDKVFWPQRQVVSIKEEQSVDHLDQVSEILESKQVYWFTTLPESHIKQLENKEYFIYNISLQKLDNNLYQLQKNGR